MKEVILKSNNGKYIISRFIRFKISKNTNFKFEYKGKLYDKSIASEKREVKQVSYLVEALNIKNKKKRLSFVYDKACDLLDDDFYGKNICGFNCGKCINDRKYNNMGGGCCCDSKHHKFMCPYLTIKGCSVRCLACKFHICDTLKKKGYKYRLNDIYILKYLLNWKQKLIIYNDFFMTKEEVLKGIYRNSIILWLFSKPKKFVRYNLDNE